MRGMTEDEFDGFGAYAKCNWLNCAGGTGLAGQGLCSFKGDWDKEKCLQFITDDDYARKMGREDMKNDVRTKPSKFALGKAAQAWCAPTTSHLNMIPELAKEFARIIQEYMEALQWCGGSADFAEGGQASIGWEKICAPLL